MSLSSKKKESITLDILQSLGQKKSANIYKKYQNTKYQNQVDIQSLHFNIEYLELQVKALYLEEPQSIAIVNDFLQKIKGNLENIKQVTSKQELKKLKDLLCDSSKKLANIPECQQGTNKYIIESINLTVDSGEYIIKKMSKILENTEKQGTIECFLKEDVKACLEKYLNEISKSNSVKNPYRSRLIFGENICKKIKCNAFIENKDIEEIKANTNKLDNDKKSPLKSKSSSDLKRLDLQLNLKYIVNQVSQLFDVNNFEKYFCDFSSYTLVLPLNNIFIKNIKELIAYLITLEKESNGIKKLELKNLIAEFNKIVPICYNSLFTKPANSLTNKQNLLKSLTQLVSPLTKELMAKVYSIENTQIRNDLLKLIKNMAQSIELTKEHLSVIISNENNSKMEKNYSYDGYQEIKQAILGIYFTITREFPEIKFNKLKRKIANLINLKPKDKDEKRSLYLQTIIYLDTVLNALESQSSQSRLLFEFNEFRTILTTKKIALLTATLKPDNENFEQTREQKENLAKFYQNITRKNAIDIIHEQIKDTIKCLNEDYKILEKNIPAHYRDSFSLEYFKYFNNDPTRILANIKKIKRLLDSNQSDIKFIKLRLQSTHLKLNFLQQRIKLYKELRQKQIKQEDICINFNNFFMQAENEFIKKLVEIKPSINHPSLFDKFLQLETIIFNPLNTTFDTNGILNNFEIEQSKVRLQYIKNLLNELLTLISKEIKNKEVIKLILEKFFISVNGLENQIVEFLTPEKKPHKNCNNNFFNLKSTQNDSDLTSAGNSPSCVNPKPLG